MEMADVLEKDNSSQLKVTGFYLNRRDDVYGRVRTHSKPTPRMLANASFLVHLMSKM